MTQTRILHVVANLRHGGVQSWIMDLAAQARADGIQMDVLCYSDQQWPLSGALDRLGVRVFICTRHRNPLALLQALRAIVRKHGPYAALHAHEMYQNGALMLAGALLRVPVRISHAHNSAQAVQGTRARRLYNAAMQKAIAAGSTHMLAVSELAGRKLYGAGWKADPRTAVVHCGLDFSAYAAAPDPAVRQALGIPAQARVIGHAGRFVSQKNHVALLDMAAAVMRDDESIWLLLVGDGATRPAMQEKAEALGIAARTVFTGARSDVPELVVNGFDILLLPSLFEGLGLVVLEALAAGKPCVISDVVPPEADVVPELITRVPLEAPVAVWGEAIRSALNKPSDRAAAYRSVISSQFAIGYSYRAMLGYYAAGLVPSPSGAA